MAGKHIDTVFVDVLPDLSKFATKAHKDLDSALDGVIRDADKAATEIEKSFEDAGKAIAESMRSALGGLGKDIEKATRGGADSVRKSRGIFKSEGDGLGSSLVSGVLSAFGDGVSSIGKTLGSAISAAGPYVQAAAYTVGIGAAAALAPTIAALGLALPAAAGVGVAAIGTLTLGFQGLGDAIENAGDPEKFAESLKKLTPAAQSFAIEVKNLMPAFSSIRAAAQEGIFAGFEGQLTRLTNALKGPLIAGFAAVGKAIQHVGKELVDLGIAQDSIDTLNGVFVTTAKIINEAAPSVQTFLAGIGDLVRKALPFVARLSELFGAFLENIGQGLSDAAKGGTLDAIFSNGLETLTRLWEVGKDVWDVFKGLFGVALDSSGPLLDAIQGVTRAFADFFKDKDNLEALGILFQGLGFALQLLTLQLKISLKVFSFIVDVVKAIVQWIPKAVSAVGDFGKAVGKWFSEAWDAVSNFFSGIGKWLGDTASSIGRWFSEAWGAAEDATSSAIDSIFTFFRELPGRIGRFLSALPGVIVGALVFALSAALKAVGVAVGLILFAVLELPKRIPGALASLWETVSTFFVNLWNSVAAFTVDAWNGIIAWLTALPFRILGAIVSLSQIMYSFFIGLWNSIFALTVSAWNATIAWLAALPFRILAAIVSLGSMLQSFFVTLWANVQSWAVSGWNAVINFIQSVPGRIAALGATFYNAGLGLIRGFFNGLASAAGFAANVGNAIFNTFKSGLNWAIRQINSGIAAADDVLPGSLPRIPQLATGGIALGPSIVGEAGPEAALPLAGQRGRQTFKMIAEAATSANPPVTFGPGAVVVSFEGVVPTEGQARTTGEAVGRGILGILAQRNARVQIRTA